MNLVTEQDAWACAFSSPTQLEDSANQYRFEEPTQTQKQRSKFQQEYNMHIKIYLTV